MGERAAADHGDARGGKRLKPKGMLAEATHSVLAWLCVLAWLIIQLFHFLLFAVIAMVVLSSTTVPSSLPVWSGT